MNRSQQVAQIIDLFSRLQNATAPLILTIKNNVPTLVLRSTPIRQTPMIIQKSYSPTFVSVSMTICICISANFRASNKNEERQTGLHEPHHHPTGANFRRVSKFNCLSFAGKFHRNCASLPKFRGVLQLFRASDVHAGFVPHIEPGLLRGADS